LTRLGFGRNEPHKSSQLSHHPRFYLGYIGIGFAQLAITVCTLGLAGWIWPLIDAILILTGKVTDAQGRTLRD
jgi:TM2 domain-containing membrane protein YozV